MRTNSFTADYAVAGPSADPASLATPVSAAARTGMIRWGKFESRKV